MSVEIIEVAQIEAVPERSLLIASGTWAEIRSWDSPLPTGGQNWHELDHGTIRPLPAEWQERIGGPRRFEFLPLGSSTGRSFKIATSGSVTHAEIIWAPHDREDINEMCERCGLLFEEGRICTGVMHPRAGRTHEEYEEYLAGVVGQEGEKR